MAESQTSSKCIKTHVNLLKIIQQNGATFNKFNTFLIIYLRQSHLMKAPSNKKD